MTDQELIKQLRCFDSLSDVPDAAADRIEELERENAEMAAAISDAENGGICSGGNLWRFWSKVAREISVKNLENREKLAEAVAGLRKIAGYTHIGEPGQGVKQHAEARIAIATLAKLEKKE